MIDQQLKLNGSLETSWWVG